MFPCLLKYVAVGILIRLLSLSLWGVVKEENLIARWSFDEGNGSVAERYWWWIWICCFQVQMPIGELESNGTAISKYSLSLRDGDSYLVTQSAHAKPGAY